MPRVSKRPKALKEHSVIIRMTEENKQMMLRAAQHEGLNLSSWIRHIAIKEASKILPDRRYESEDDRRRYV